MMPFSGAIVVGNTGTCRSTLEHVDLLEAIRYISLLASALQLNAVKIYWSWKIG